MKTKKVSFKPSKLKESILIPEDQISEFEEKGYSIKRIRGQYRAFREMEKWEAFEEEIRKFLGILRFENVNSAPINLGGHDVDAVGGRDDTFLVIECKTRRQIRDSAKSELEKFNGWKQDVTKAVRLKYPQYSNIKFIFCTDFRIEPNSEKFAKENQIILWDYNYIKEYEDLYYILGDSTKYHILFELGCKPKLTEEFFVPAFRLHQRKKTIYNFMIDPETLLKIAYVFRRTSSQREQAYQRPLSGHRLERIRKFLEEDGGMFLNNIIINFKESPHFDLVKTTADLPHYLEFGILKIPNNYCSAELIDGQHRTYGFTKAEKAKKEVKLSVTALDGASEVERATFFIKINKEQKPVPADLLWDLAGEIEPHTETGTISNVVKQLNKESPFKDCIAIPSETTKDTNIPIKISNFCNGIEDRELIKIFKTQDELLNNLKALFLVVADLFAFDWKLGKKGFICANAGVNVMLRILRRLLIMKKETMPTKSEISKLLGSIATYFKKTYYKKDKPNSRKLSDIRKKCASEAGRGDVEKEFWDALVKENPSYGITE